MGFATGDAFGRTGLAGETAPVHPGLPRTTPARTELVVRVAAVVAAAWLWDRR
jgi:hypothetical protein